MIFTLRNMMKEISKNTLRRIEGEIHIYPSGWRFSEQGCTNAQGVHIKARIDPISGKMMSLQIERYANNCPEPPNQSEHVLGKFGYWVPFKVCRQCPNHQKRRRGTPFASCKVLVNINKNVSPIGEISKVVTEAQQKVDQMLKGLA